eukprot:jgi/Botrbrau1/16312/Bobra.0066s0080.1
MTTNNRNWPMITKQNGLSTRRSLQVIRHFGLTGFLQGIHAIRFGLRLCDLRVKQQAKNKEEESGRRRKGISGRSIIPVYGSDVSQL